MSRDANMRRYAAAAHAMQSGVAMRMNADPSDTTPKHLRVGVNVALRDQASLVKLLVDKGVITDEEYVAAIADGMQEEAAQYEQLITEQMGAQPGKIKLG